MRAIQNILRARRSLLGLVACISICLVQLGCTYANTFPSNAAGWDERACEKYEREEYDKAIEDWDQAVKLDDANPVYWWRRSRACRHVGRTQQAVDDATHALDLASPKDSRRRMFYLDTRAKALMKLGKFEDAAKDFDEAVKLAEGKSDVAPIYMDRGEMHLELADPKLALDDFSEAIKLVPTWGRAYFFRAKAYDALDDHANADKDRSSARQMNFDELSDKYEPLSIRSTI
ncbi:tetratricopeptide repeat protein [Candidatus Obscuribacterales bacterium]|nr:tetratricopeptide repeat protein [Candidatus Obscuribacterales bacterium]